MFRHPWALTRDTMACRQWSQSSNICTHVHVDLCTSEMHRTKKKGILELANVLNVKLGVLNVGIYFILGIIMHGWAIR